MCLMIYKDVEKQKAKENIPCYKELWGLHSMNQDFYYIRFWRNKEVSIYPILLTGPYNVGCAKIEHGYHARNENNFYRLSHLFIIPKGSEYYEGTENRHPKFGKDCYVSSNIIYVGKNNRFNRWLAKLLYGVTFKSENQIFTEQAHGKV